MRIRDDDRGVALQVGVALLLAFLVVAVSIYQVQVVPDQNRQVELKHSEAVQSDLQNVRDAVVSVPGGGSGRSVSVAIGTTYPSRTLFVNPPPVSGQLRTTAGANISLTNARAVTPETRDFWDGTTRNVTTKALVYRPNYHEWTGAPDTVYENTVLFDTYDDGNRDVVQTDQTLVDGNTINLVALQGNVSTGRVGSLSVDLRAASTSTRVVPVTNDGGPITITIPTRLSRTEWTDLLSDEPNASVGSISSGPNGVRFLKIELAPGDYRLRMAKVGVGRNVDTERSTYVTDVRGDDATVPTDGNQTLTVEVRDRYNNPISGESVEATVVDGGGSVAGSGTETTDADGRASFTYRAPGSEETARIAVNLTGPDAPRDYEQVVFTVDVESTGGGGGDTGAYAVEWTSSGAALDCNANVTRCELDAGGADYVRGELGITTSPVADGATVQYAVNDTAVATISPRTGTTNASGANTTRINASAEGSVSVYASSGGSGDVVTVDVVNVGGGPKPVISAFQSDPENMSDGNGEFVRVYFPESTSTTGWHISDSEDENSSFPSGPLSGDVYFARDKSEFASQRGIDQSRVFDLDTVLEQGGERIELRNQSGALIDQVAYGSKATVGSDPWSLRNLAEGEVAVRKSGGATTYQDTDSKNDWQFVSEGSFFGGSGSCTPEPGIVYVTPGENLKNVGQNGCVYSFDPAKTGSVKAVGPFTADVDEDGVKDVPFINGNGELKLIDLNGNVQTLVDSNTFSPGLNTVRMGVGTWGDGSGDAEVFFVDGNNELRRVDDDSDGPNSPERIVKKATGSGPTYVGNAGAVSGIADVNGDTDTDILFVQNGEIRYVENKGNSGNNQIKSLGATPNDAKAISNPADIDSDPAVDVGFKAGSVPYVRTADDPNGVQSPYPPTDKPQNAPMAAFDITGDGTTDLVFVNQSGYLKYVNTSGTGIVTDSDGDPIDDAKQGPPGTASVRDPVEIGQASTIEPNDRNG